MTLVTDDKCFNPRSQRHRVGSIKVVAVASGGNSVSIRVHSGIGLEDLICEKWIAIKEPVSIRVHSGIGLEAQQKVVNNINITTTGFNPRSQRHRVGRRRLQMTHKLFGNRFNPRSQRHRVGSSRHS